MYVVMYAFMAMWTYGRALRRGQVPFPVHIKVGPGPSVAMEHERAISTGNTLTSRNPMQKAAMFAPIPLTPPLPAPCQLTKSRWSAVGT